MKSKLYVVVMTVVILPMMILAGCGGGTPGPTDGTTIYTLVTLQGGNQSVFEGTIENAAPKAVTGISRSAAQRSGGGEYTLTIVDGTDITISSGTFTGTPGDTLTLKPAIPGATSDFTISTSSNNGITGIGGTITDDIGHTQSAPASLTPKTPQTSTDIVGYWEDAYPPLPIVNIAAIKTYFSDLAKDSDINGDGDDYWVFAGADAADIREVFKDNNVPYTGTNPEGPESIHYWNGAWADDDILVEYKDGSSFNVMHGKNAVALLTYGNIHTPVTFNSNSNGTGVWHEQGTGNNEKFDYTLSGSRLAIEEEDFEGDIVRNGDYLIIMGFSDMPWVYKKAD